MKKLLTVILSLGCYCAFAQEGVNFRDISFGEALEDARSENKYIFVDCYTSWCGPCKIMAEKRFPMKVMGDYFNPRFVSVKYDCEKHPDGIHLAKEHKVTAYPTFLIFRPDGSYMTRVIGGGEAVDFIQNVEDSFDHDRVYDGLTELYENYGYSSLKTYIEDYKGQADPALKEELVKLWTGLNNDDKTEPQYWFISSTINFVEPGSEIQTFLMENAEEFRRKNGKENVDTHLVRHYKQRLMDIIRGADEMTPEEVRDLTARVNTLGLEGLDPYIAIALTAKKGDVDEHIAVIREHLMSTSKPVNVYFANFEYYMDKSTDQQRRDFLQIGEDFSDELNGINDWFQNILDAMKEKYL